MGRVRDERQEGHVAQDVVGLCSNEFSRRAEFPGFEQVAQAVHTQPPADVDDTIIDERP
jgi:hypothetical protein